MSRLLVFNPDHDYALANRGHIYTPPSRILKLAAALQWLPELWAEENDVILLADGSFFNICNGDFLNDPQFGISMIDPWGWNESLVYRLSALGIEKSLLPDESRLNRQKELSHRRISIRANRFLDSPSVPIECFSVEEGLDFFIDNPGCYFKLPWSSGGRGVLATEELNLTQVREWLSGAIRRQGSVMAEVGISRSLDFASLWSVSQGDVDFLGYSVSKSDGRGKYGGNLSAPQPVLKNIIESHSDFDEDIIYRQKSFIEKEIAPAYEGKLGIDMIADSKGDIWPCVEINLRRTMGHVAIAYRDFLESGKRLSHDMKIPIIEYD